MSIDHHHDHNPTTGFFCYIILNVILISEMQGLKKLMGKEMGIAFFKGEACSVFWRRE